MRTQRLFGLFVICAALFVGCSDPDSHELDLDPGSSIFTINNESYAAEAILGTRLFRETEYEQIILRVGDSIQVDIMNLNFEEGIVIWDGETFEAEGTRVFVVSQVHGGAGFGPTGGYLLISNKTDSSISGKFNIDLYNYASSCLNCPGNSLTIEGQFVAGKN